MDECKPLPTDRTVFPPYLLPRTVPPPPDAVLAYVALVLVKGRKLNSKANEC